MATRKGLFSTKKIICWYFRDSRKASTKTKEWCMTDSLAIDPSCPRPRVVVIGAGMAGLSAAERLIDCGIKDVTLLEALPRPGGRVHTEDTDGTPFEYGASFILGCCPANSVYTLACQGGAMKQPLERIKPSREVCFDSQGRATKATVYQAAWKLFIELMADAKKRTGKKPLDRDVWSYLSQKINAVCKYFPESDQEMAKMTMFAFTNNLRLAYGAELNKVPLAKIGLKKRIPGGDLSAPNGMSRVLKPLIATCGSGLKLGHIVKKIHWDPKTAPSKSRVVVFTHDRKAWPADYIISTLPLGVLKETHCMLFDPPLPKEKLDAIDRIDQGHINSVCMKYKKPFWFPNEGQIRICWPPEVILKGEHWTHGIGQILELTGTRDTLRILVTGKAAKQLESLSELQLIRDVTTLIRRFLGDSSLPMPSHVTRSKWSSDPFFRGGVTYLGQKGRALDQEALAEPLPAEVAPSLLFAGEATAPGHNATMNGARLSGIREAERILRLTKCFSGPPPGAMKFCN